MHTTQFYTKIFAVLLLVATILNVGFYFKAQENFAIRQKQLDAYSKSNAFKSRELDDREYVLNGRIQCFEFVWNAYAFFLSNEENGAYIISLLQECKE